MTAQELVAKHGDEIRKRKAEDPKGFGRQAVSEWLNIAPSKARRVLDQALRDSKPQKEDNLTERGKRALKNGPLTVTELANALDVSPKRAQEVIEELGDGPRALVSTAEGYVLPKVPALTEPKHVKVDESGQWRQFALVSDTHGASKHEQLTALHQFYDLLEAEGITHVFHAGDMTHGRKVYKGIDHDVKLHSYPGQARHVIRTYPKREGITTYFICGNHDEDAVKNDADDPGEVISRGRDDLIYLGMYAGHINYEGLRVQLQHGGGGRAYAETYKLQKYLEKLPRTEERPPHIYSLGHYHSAVFLPDYQGVHAFLPGAFEGQNHLLKRLGIYPKPQAWIVEARISGDELREVKYRLLSYPLEEGSTDYGTENVAAEK